MTIYHTVYTAGDCLWTMQNGGVVRTWVVQGDGEFIELHPGDEVPGDTPDAWMIEPGGNGSHPQNDDTIGWTPFLRPSTPPTPDDTD